LKRKKRVQLYTLSTCVWCKRAKRFLNEMGVEYDFVDVDLLPPGEERRIREELDDLNPDGGFPVMIVDNKEVIRGYDEDQFREALL
jgi:glutaredoxin-like protein NrdH